MESVRMSENREIGLSSSGWPFQEARKLLKRYPGGRPEKGHVLFETGYGPSGLPHIGTFGEVARTSMVRHAFSVLSDVPTRLIAFSDDMDGLRKVPENVPNQELLAAHLHQPLSRIPDPFGTHESFAHHNNARLKAFLDQFGFEYEFLSSSECYSSGRFDDALLGVLACYQEILDVILPTLGEERRRTYSPILPISPKTGRVLQVPLLERDASRGTIVFEDEDGSRIELPVTGGNCKLQWKADWAMRWVALDVDYEMAGKDLIDSVNLSGRICRLLGGRPPEGFIYELFLDENGEKISKSRGNGLTIEEWLRYASPESLSLYMYHSPRKAKRLYFDVIPRTVDEYFGLLEKFPHQGPTERLANPVWHVHSGTVPEQTVPISFALLLNLAGVVHTEDRQVLWAYISRYVPEASPASHPLLDQAVSYAINFYRDFVKPTKKYRLPSDIEKAALQELAGYLERIEPDTPAEVIQTEIYEIGKRHPFENLRQWFKALYELLLGQPQGPRMGSFVALYGVEETLSLIRRILAGEPLD